jgi:hypothetical protein
MRCRVVSRSARKPETFSAINADTKTGYTPSAACASWEFKLQLAPQIHVSADSRFETHAEGDRRAKKFVAETRRTNGKFREKPYESSASRSAKSWWASYELVA